VKQQFPQNQGLSAGKIKYFKPDSLSHLKRIKFNFDLPD